MKKKEKLHMNPTVHVNAQERVHKIKFFTSKEFEEPIFMEDAVKTLITFPTLVKYSLIIFIRRNCKLNI
jgi:hypothetical protein